MNDQSKHRNNSTIEVTNEQTVINWNGESFVLMGRVCKALNLKDSVGMGLIRRIPATFDRHKIRISTKGQSPNGSPVVAIPLEKVSDWLDRICPIFVGDTEFGDEVRAYQKGREIGQNPDWPETLSSLLITGNGEASSLAEPKGVNIKPASSDTSDSAGATMSSVEIAELTGKQHAHVKRDIEVMCGQLGVRYPSLEGEYKAANGQIYKDYRLDRYHTEVLVTGYDVKRRAAVIKRWHDLESGKEQPIATKKASRAELILQQAQALVEHERRLDELEREQEDQRRKIHETESQLRAITEGEEYFTVSAYCNIKGIKADSAEAGRIGKRASYFCRSKDWHMGSARHPRFGTVKTYPSEALELALSSLGGAA